MREGLERRLLRDLRTAMAEHAVYVKQTHTFFIYVMTLFHAHGSYCRHSK